MRIPSSFCRPNRLHLPKCFFCPFLQWRKSHSFHQRPFPHLILIQGNPYFDSRISLLAWPFFSPVSSFPLFEVTSIRIHTKHNFYILKSILDPNSPFQQPPYFFVPLYNRNTWNVVCTYNLKFPFSNPLLNSFKSDQLDLILTILPKLLLLKTTATPALRFQRSILNLTR